METYFHFYFFFILLSRRWTSLQNLILTNGKRAFGLNVPNTLYIKNDVNYA